MVEIKNLKEVAERIKKAILKKEKIVLYGDADLDGVASLIILKETIKNLEGRISTIYFPDREKEGYGISIVALDYLKEISPALLISLDCGIGNFQEIELAKKLGFEVIVIDHHEILGKLPQASIVIDPKQKGDKYPFKGLATAGIVLKLSEILLKEKLTEKLRQNFLELVALATLADLMPRIDENRIFIEEGLNSLKNTWRPGLKAFLEIQNSKSPFELAHKITSALNVGEKKNHLNEAYLILTEKEEDKAKILAINLLEKSVLRQMRIREITNEVEERIMKKINEKIVFEGDSNWPLTFLGPVASRICYKYQKPIFLFRIDNTESQGAVRVPRGIDSVKAMASCSEILETYGGHAPASGFRIKNENLERFKECLIKYFEK